MRRLRRIYALCRMAHAMRVWPWDKRLRMIGTERPPEEVFEAFRRLHGLSNSPTEDTTE